MSANQAAIRSTRAILIIDTDNVGHEVFVLRLIHRSPGVSAPDVHTAVFSAASYRVSIEKYDAANRASVGGPLRLHTRIRFQIDPDA